MAEQRRLFMVDIETRGLSATVPGAEILQFAFLELLWDGETRLYKPGDSLNVYLPSDAQPGEWAEKNGQASLYANCNRVRKNLLETGGESAVEGYLAGVKEAPRDFFARCGVTNPNDVYLAGRNVAQFDLKWLYHFGYLAPKDHHYRLVEMTGALQMLVDATNCTKETADDLALTVGVLEGMPASLTKHDGLSDCYLQAKSLNGLITLLRAGSKALYELAREAKS